MIITNDVLDVRELIERFEELEGGPDSEIDLEESDEEFNGLKQVLDDLCGNGGDHVWRGHWYPVTLIRDGYFEEYAEQLAEELDLIKPDAHWPNNCIDWERAASELQVDYASVEVDGVRYLYRYR